MWLKSLMMPHSKNNSWWIPPPLVEEVHTHLWRDVGFRCTICPSLIAHGVACHSVGLKERQQTTFLHRHFTISMPAWRRIPICHCQGYKRLFKVWLVLAIFCSWTWSLDSGRSRWMNHWSSTLHLLLVTWASLSVTTCLLVCAMHQLHFKGWCKTALESLI